MDSIRRIKVNEVNWKKIEEPFRSNRLGLVRNCLKIEFISPINLLEGKKTDKRREQARYFKQLKIKL